MEINKRETDQYVAAVFVPLSCLLEISLCGLSSDQEVTDDFWLGDGGVVVQEIEGSQWLLKSWKSNISSIQTL